MLHHFLQISRAYEYRTVQDAEAAIRRVGVEIETNGLPVEICPLSFTFTSIGDMSLAAQRLFKLLPHKLVDKQKLKQECELPVSARERFSLLMVVALHSDLVKRKDGQKFNKDEYKKDAQNNKALENYIPIFHEEILPYTSVLVNCMYWDKQFPRLVTIQQMKQLVEQHNSRLLIVGELGCDPSGPVEFFSKDTPINNAFYFYNPLTGSTTDTYDIEAPKYSILLYGVSHIPAELPRDASTFFGDNLLPYVPILANSNYSQKWEDDTLPDDLKQATETYRGKLTPNYSYLEQAVLNYGGKEGDGGDALDNNREKGRTYTRAC